MKREELHFDEDGLIIDVIIPNLNQELSIDKNYDSDFDIENQLDFAKYLIDTSDTWYPIAFNHILSETNDKSDFLKIIYLLDDSVFGLPFELVSEPEHGYGMKLNSKKLEILELGEAFIAFA